MSEQSADTEWMDGRSVFFFPESRGSNVLRRCIIGSDAEQDRLSETAAWIILERRTMTDADVEAEIAEYEEYMGNRQLP